MSHICHAYKCNIQIPPKMLMCLKHWRKVPREIQNKIWATYRPGQEIDKIITEEYSDAFDNAVESVARKEGYILPVRYNK